MAEWPLELPQRALINGYSESSTDQTISTQTAVGPSLTRRRYSTSVVKLSVSYLMSDSQFLLFKDWFYSEGSYSSIGIYGGSLPFSMPHPRAGSAVEARIKPATYSITQQAPDKNIVSVTVEIL